MAAMAQLDCGACGYLCQTYAEAIADGEEKDLTALHAGRQGDGEEAQGARRAAHGTGRRQRRRDGRQRRRRRPPQRPTRPTTGDNPFPARAARSASR